MRLPTSLSYAFKYPLSIFQVSTHTSRTLTHRPPVTHSHSATTQGISGRTPARLQLIELYSTHLAVYSTAPAKNKKKKGVEKSMRAECVCGSVFMA